MNVDPVTFGIFKSFFVGDGLGWNKLLGQPEFFQKLELKTGGGKDVRRIARRLGLSQGSLEHPFASAPIERWFNEWMFFLKCIDKGNDLLVVKRAVEHNLVLGFGGFFQGCGFRGRA